MWHRIGGGIANVRTKPGRCAIGEADAVICVRNTGIEDLHAGTVPVSHAIDHSDVLVMVANARQIPWPDARPDPWARARYTTDSGCPSLGACRLRVAGRPPLNHSGPDLCCSAAMDMRRTSSDDADPALRSQRMTARTSVSGGWWRGVSHSRTQRILYDTPSNDTGSPKLPS